MLKARLHPRLTSAGYRYSVIFHGCGCALVSRLLCFGHGPAARHHRGVCRSRLYARPMLLPSMPRDAAKADQLASSHLDETDRRAAFSTTALRGMRRSGAFGQAVASGGRAGQAVGAKGLGPK
jgi:hypothetical protein